MSKTMTVRVPPHWHGKPGFRPMLATLVNRHRALTELRQATEAGSPDDYLQQLRREYIRLDDLAGRSVSYMVGNYGEDP